jgi:hypothetical protein
MSDLQLTPELKNEIIAAATAHGLSVEEYLRTIINRDKELVKKTLTPKEKARAFREWAENFPSKNSSPLSDEAISRESIYAEREDKQL